MLTKIKERMESGFTLVEVLIVVVILGTLAAITIPTYLKYVERGYSSDAKVTIQAILEASEIYYQESHKIASDVEVLTEEGLLGLKRSILTKWDFTLALSEDPREGLIGTITATSLPDMQAGEGKILTYFLERGKYKGYGQKEK